MTRYDSDGVFRIPSGIEWVKAMAKFVAGCICLLILIGAASWLVCHLAVHGN
jgi:hypothetical protein